MYKISVRPVEYRSSTFILTCLYQAREWIDLPNTKIQCQVQMSRDGRKMWGEIICRTNDVGAIDVKGVAGFLQNVMGGHIVIDLESIGNEHPDHSANAEPASVGN